MQANVVDFAKDRVVYNITGCTRAELDNKLNLFFSSNGYQVKSENGETKTWKKGNRVMRILFGAFAKYHQQGVTIKQEGDLFSLLFFRDSTGMSGGAIGMNQVRKEFTRLSEAFKAYFNN